ncbi:MAG: protoglobin domain-containing protein [Pseudoclavibacter sp.]|nr:protoglobin domain-containing protein [Pseudoclavibacter sp.]
MSDAETLDMVALAREARDQMPPNAAFRDVDEAVLAQHRDFLTALEGRIVQSFYDTVYGHHATAAVFRDGERPAREQSLGAWWRRTAQGPHDEEYFSWMAMVGLVHVVRGVSNPMMISMADHASREVAAAARDSQLPPEEADRLSESCRRLLSTVSGVITYGYDRAVENALFEIAGMPPALLHRLRDQSVGESLEHARKDLARPAG